MVIEAVSPSDLSFGVLGDELAAVVGTIGASAGSWVTGCYLGGVSKVGL